MAQPNKGSSSRSIGTHSIIAANTIVNKIVVIKFMIAISTNTWDLFNLFSCCLVSGIAFSSHQLPYSLQGKAIKLDVDLSSLATKLGRKIKTENYYALKVSIKREGRRRGVPEVINLTKVTLL